MRKSPAPADRQLLVKPEGADVDRAPSPKPPRPPRISTTSPPRSPQPPPRPPSIKGSSSASLPPPRPPPPAKKQGDGEIMIDYPTGSKSPLLSPSSPDAKGFVPTRAYSPSPSSTSSHDSSSPGDKSRGSVRGSQKYKRELNPFADDMEEEEEEGEVTEDKTDTTQLVTGQQSPPANRASLNPFFSASVKKKWAPNPPKEAIQQRSVSNTEISHERSGSDIKGQRSGSGRVNVDNQKGADDGKDSGDGGQFDPTVTSGSTNEKATASEANNPVVIVSVCLN